MQGKLYIGNVSGIEEELVFNLGCHLLEDADFTISYESDNDVDIEKVLNPEAIKESIELTIDIADDEESLKELEAYRDNYQDLASHIEIVSIGYPLDKAIAFLKQNPSLLSKKIIFTNVKEYEVSEVQLIKDNLDDTTNLYLDVYGDSKPMAFSDYEATLKVIDDIVKTIEGLSLSPLEEVFFVYDLLKERIYKESGENNLAKSRDLSKILFSDNIVCVGYTKLFNVILGRLGIKAEECDLESLIDADGHLRSILYIDDKKYDVEGFFYFDSTWDSKKEEDDSSYFYTYRYFGLPKEEMQKYDERKKIVDIRFPMYYQDMVFEFEEKYRASGFDNISTSMIRSINTMWRLVKGEPLISPLYYNKKSPFYNKFDIDKDIDELININEYFRYPIYAETLIDVLLNVRVVEYRLGKIKYPVSKDDILRTVFVSKWQFEKGYTSIFKEMTDDPKLCLASLYSDYEDFFKSNNLEERIRLIKELK